MSTRAHVAIKKKDGEFLHMHHHCDGYPSGVGSELVGILKDFDKSNQVWEPENLQKFINEQEDDYRITEHGVVWDQEYVYIIDCDRKVLSGYYKGLEKDYDLDCPGDELLISGNVFSSDKNDVSLGDYDNVFHEAIQKWGIVNQVFMVMEECGELLNVLAKAKRERSTPEEIITELADVSIMCDQMAYHFGKKAFLDEKKRKLERLKKRVFGEI